MQDRKFTIGDYVRISESSQYYRKNDISNPIDQVGFINKFDHTFDNDIYVQWKNGKTNVYQEKDLILSSVYHKFTNDIEDDGAYDETI